MTKLRLPGWTGPGRNKKPGPQNNNPAPSNFSDFEIVDIILLALPQKAFFLFRRNISVPERYGRRSDKSPARSE